MSPHCEKLRSHGLKITPKRQAIIAFFEKAKRTLRPEEVWTPLKKKFGRLGLPSVYRNLESLVECGILTRIHKFDNNRHYALCHASEHHHHHIVCVKCGKIGEFESCRLEKITAVEGFRVLKHFVQLEGVCAGCEKH